MIEQHESHGGEVRCSKKSAFPAQQATTDYKTTRI